MMDIARQVGKISILIALSEMWSFEALRVEFVIDFMIMALVGVLNTESIKGLEVVLSLMGVLLVSNLAYTWSGRLIVQQ
jgi:hypothetical protein